MNAQLIAPRPRLRCSLLTLCPGPGALRRAAIILLCLSLPASRAAEPKADRAQAASAELDVTEVSLQDLMTFKVQSVYGASKHEQKVSEAPSSVTIIDSDEIKMYG